MVVMVDVALLNDVVLDDMIAKESSTGSRYDRLALKYGIDVTPSMCSAHCTTSPNPSGAKHSIST